MIPKVTVLMPVHNGELYLREAVESILTQTFREYEFIIVDDGSTDGTREILASYDDPRIKIMRNERNLGIVFSLNRGLEHACGEYIARMDGDDISLPTRLARQLDYLSANPEIGMAGTWIQRMDEHGRSQGVARLPTTVMLVRWVLLFENCFAHPSTMFRRELVRDLKGYDESARHAEDYDLWVRLVSKTGATNIPEPLVRLRRHSQRVSVLRRQERGNVIESVAQRAAATLLAMTIPLESVQRLLTGLRQDGALTASELHDATCLLSELYRGFSRHWRGSQGRYAAVRLDLARRLARLAANSTRRQSRAARATIRRALATDLRIVATRPFLKYLITALRQGTAG